MTVRYTADLHFRHRNIIGFCKRPFTRADGQPDIELHDACLIHDWNLVVQPEDETYVLGDFMFGNGAQCKEYLSRLNGKKYLIRGNHDKHSMTFYQNAGFERVEKHLWVQEPGHPPTLLVHRPQDAKPWCQGEEKPIVLCGHVHERWNYANCVTRYPTDEKVWAHFYNVGVDVRNWRPVTLDELAIKWPWCG